MRNTIFFLLSLNISLHAQNTICTTPGSYPDLLSQKANTTGLRTASSSYTVNVFFHIVRNSDGSGGQNVNVINTIMNNLYTAYSSLQIYFNNAGSDEIKNSYYTTNFFNNGDLTIYNSLINQNTKCNSINIYLLDDNSTFVGGLANGIPGTALVVGGTFSPPDGSHSQLIVPSLVVPHEVGHCLGLYHTFETQSFGAELVNESNCSTAGDLVCDTNASNPNYNFHENSQCAWTVSFTDANNQTYNPDPHNIMAYVRPSCLQYFSTGQGIRSRSIIANSDVLAPMLTLIFSGPSLICSNTSTFSITTLPTGFNVQWTSSNPSALQITGGQGTATATFTRQNNINGAATITATVSGGGCGTTLQQNVWVGQPNAPGSLNKNINNPPFCVGSTVIASINAVGGASTYSWVSNNPSMLEVSGSGNYVNLLADAAGTCTFSVTTTNTCGSTSKNYIASLTDCSGGGQMAVTAYPNPASSSMTVSVTDSLASTNSVLLPQPYQLNLYDRFGTSTYSVQSDQHTLQVPVGSLPQGVYYINVLYKDAVLRRQVLIQH
ncbi:MAG: zinc-dependent metalloprotease [Bacteroidetes bacterium]|nr:zinc-dependent metalloprotease [Bacteroidota bacterium]